MKRYLLLASVAGCLMSAGNAWADDPISEDGQSVTLQASVDIVAAEQITDFRDISFDKIVLLGQPADGSGIASVTPWGGVTTSNTNVFVPHSNVGSCGVVCKSGEGNLRVTCADGSDAEENVCEFSEGLGFDYAAASGMSTNTYCDEKEAEYVVWGDLVKIGEDDLSNGYKSGAAIVVTLDY